MRPLTLGQEGSCRFTRKRSRSLERRVAASACWLGRMDRAPQKCTNRRDSGVVRACLDVHPGGLMRAVTGYAPDRPAIRSGRLTVPCVRLRDASGHGRRRVESEIGICANVRLPRSTRRADHDRFCFQIRPARGLRYGANKALVMCMWWRAWYSRSATNRGRQTLGRKSNAPVSR